MEEIDLKDILKLIWKKKIQVIIITVFFIIAGLIYTLNFVTPKYQSYTTLVLAQNVGTSQFVIEDGAITQMDLALNEKLVKTYSELAKSDSVLEKVINNLKIDRTISGLRKGISVNEVDETELIKITASDENPEIAKNIANEIAKQFIEKIQEIYNISNIYVVDEAKTSELPYNINHAKDVIIFAFVGAVISFGYVILLNLFDSTIKKANEVEQIVKVIGEVPVIDFDSKDRSKRVRKLFVFENSKSAEAEIIKKIRTRIQYMFSNKKLTSLLITSSVAGEGKSVIVSNLSASFAQIGYKVLIVDADMRKPKQHSIFGVKQALGLSNYLSETDDMGEKFTPEDIDAIIQDTVIDNLKIITAGNIPSNASELLASKRFEELIEKLKDDFDIVIFDGTPSNVVTDSIIISRFVDATIMLAEQNIARQDTIAKIKKEIEEVDGKLVGVILNKVEMTKKEYNYNYKYYSDTNLPRKIK